MGLARWSRTETMNTRIDSPDYRRHAFFFALILVTAGVFHRVLWFVLQSSLSIDRYSHILLVLPLSATLLYLSRRRTFLKIGYNVAGGIAFLAVLVTFAYVVRNAGELSPGNTLSLTVFLFAASCLAAFIFVYGVAAFRAALFPLLFFLLIVPLPDDAVHAAVTTLQNGSAIATCWLFAIAHVPYARHGVILTLPRVDIYVAEECSGIRSSMVLLLSGLVMGQLYLRSFRCKVALTLAVLPIAIAKNALRIFVLSSLGMYVDPSFLSGRLHHDGGFIFFGIAFAALFLVVWLLQRLESEPKEATPEPA